MMTSFGIAVLLCSIAMATASSGSATWGYGKTKDGALGPADWHKAYPLCNGKRQSPIDIVTDDDVIESDDIAPLHVQFSNYLGLVSGDLENNGHAPTMTITRGSAKVNMNGQYILAQFHFHFGCNDNEGSEHTVNGKHFPGEMHMVFYKRSYGSLANAASKSDGLVVIGAFLKLTDHFSGFQMENIASKMHSIKKEGSQLTFVHVALEHLVAGLSSGRLPFYTYEGSLTTPPCYESVRWIVLKKPIAINKLDLAKLRMLEAKHGFENGLMCNNFRPTLPLNGRPVKCNEDDK